MKDKNIPLIALNLPTLLYNRLMRNGIDTVEKYMKLTLEDLYNIKGIGKNSIDYVINNAITEDDIEKIEDNYKEQNIIKKIEDNYKRYNNIENIAVSVLNHIDENTINGNIYDILFFTEDNSLRDDIKIEDMNISNRLKGVLTRGGYNSIKSVANEEYYTIKNLNNMGYKTFEELIQRLSKIIYVIYGDENIDKLKESIDLICDDIKQSCKDFDIEIYRPAVKVAVIVNKENVVENSIHNMDVLKSVYSDKYCRTIFENYIIDVIKKYEIITRDNLKEKMPYSMCKSGMFDEYISNLCSNNIVNDTEEGLKLYRQNILDYVNSIERDNTKKCFLYRLNGKTLEEIGSYMNVTRERVRQIIDKVLKNRPILMEDDYSYWFEKYDITEDEFKNIFNIGIESYNYLKLVYKKGCCKLKEMFDDENINAKIAQKVDVEMQKYCVKINENYIPVERGVLIRKLLEINFSEKDCLINDYYEMYLKFLEDNNLIDNEKLLFPSPRAFEARMSDQRYTVLKMGKRIRYYNIAEYDIDNLFNKLNLHLYNNKEISTKILFESNRELMNDYNILDEYELHNLMKKNEEKLDKYDIELGRMPLLKIGVVDRDAQVKDLLYKVAPIDFYEFGEFYELLYGVNRDTVCANFTKSINQYYHNGEYRMDFKPMTDEEYTIMINNMTEDLYFIDDVKDMYMSLFPNGNLEKINSYNLKNIGFKVYTNYVINNKFESASKYFKYLLNKDETIDTDKLDRRILNTVSFFSTLENERLKFNVVEYEENKYMTFDYLLELDNTITKEDLKQFAIDMENFADDKYFTIKYLVNNGFRNKLYNIGFDDWFYGALVRSNKNLKYKKIGGTFLISNINRQFKFSDFLEYVITKLRKISMNNLIEYLENQYGLSIDRYDVASAIYQSNMYYDKNNQIIYADKYVYFDDEFAIGQI